MARMFSFSEKAVYAISATTVKAMFAIRIERGSPYLMLIIIPFRQSVPYTMPFCTEIDRLKRDGNVAPPLNTGTNLAPLRFAAFTIGILMDSIFLRLLVQTTFTVTFPLDGNVTEPSIVSAPV